VNINTDPADTGGERLLYTAQQAARLLSVPVARVYALIQDGDLPTVTLGPGLRRIVAEDLRRFAYTLPRLKE